MVPTFESFMRKERVMEIIDILKTLKKLTVNDKLFWYVNGSLSRATAYLGELEINIENHEITIRKQSQMQDKIVLAKTILEAHEQEVLALYEAIKSKVESEGREEKINDIYEIIKSHA